MKLYTKTGDDGTTGLFGGARVRKDHPRLEAYGTVDETNAMIGLAAAAAGVGASTGTAAGSPAILGVLQSIQSRLFDLGADLATPSGSAHEGKVARVAAEWVTEMERWIDQFDDANAPLKTFVLPGGCELAARLHCARTVARRAERAVLALSATETVSEHAVPLLNRLSDLLFAMARAANREAGVGDVPWIQATGR
ncbi:MAG: cob(I)yrinic acid a,c-diamide adenosyltransferase [Planctomycetota bacterium]|nr:cob(I)yrinic acid a,c-diamide adenosyltransferase [Planctomycetota bacterium]MDA1106361.1 cob(I)yrinic acid a,c-diamide adenosyltransferase [Planctomycetota bacterium]